jgi:hypothetical protein
VVGAEVGERVDNGAISVGIFLDRATPFWVAVKCYRGHDIPPLIGQAMFRRRI